MPQKLVVKATAAAIIHTHHGTTLNLAAIASIIPTPTSTSTNPSRLFSETIIQNDGYTIHRHVVVSVASIIPTQLQHQPIHHGSSPKRWIYNPSSHRCVYSQHHPYPNFDINQSITALLLKDRYPIDRHVVVSRLLAVCQ